MSELRLRARRYRHARASPRSSRSTARRWCGTAPASLGIWLLAWLAYRVVRLAAIADRGRGRRRRRLDHDPPRAPGPDDLPAAPERRPGRRLRHRPPAHLQRLHRHRADPGGRRHPRPGGLVRRPEPGEGRHLRLLHPVREPVRHRRRGRGRGQERRGRKDDHAGGRAARPQGRHARDPQQRDQGGQQHDPRLVAGGGGRGGRIRGGRGSGPGGGAGRGGAVLHRQGMGDLSSTARWRCPGSRPWATAPS